MILDRQTNHQMRGRFRVQVVDSRTKRIKKDYGWQKNLILNAGMEMVAARSFANCFVYCVAGTGTTSNVDSSGLTAATQSGTGVTISGGAFTFSAGDVGNMIKWTTGEEARITVYNSASSVTVANSATVSSGTFTLYRTNQTGLTTETKRSNTYLTGAGNCETVDTNATGKRRYRRTYDFSAEVGSVSYTEIGVSYTATVAANLFSRIKLASAVACIAADQLRVIYELELTVTPSAPRSITPTITNWSNTGGNEMCENYALNNVLSTGATNATVFHTNEPVNNGKFVMTDSTTALASQPSSSSSPAVNRTGTVSVQKSGTVTYGGTFSWYVTKSVTFLTSEGNINGIRSIFFGDSPGTVGASVAFLLTNAQNKLNTTALTLNWKFAWSRVLS